MTAAGRRVLLPIRGADPRRRPAPGSGLDAVVPVVENGALLTFSGVETVRRWRTIARFVTALPDEVDGLARLFGARDVVHDLAGPVRTRRPAAADAGVEVQPFGFRGLAGPLSEGGIDGLRDALSKHPAIEKAWVVEATIDGSDVVVAAFQVEAGHEDAGALVRSLTPEVVPSLPVDLYEGVQLVVLTDDEVAGAVRASDEPIYERS